MAFEFAVTLAIVDDLPVVPTGQAARGGQPNTPIFVGENGPYDCTRQALFCGERCDGIVAKAVQARVRSDPNIAFSILKESVNVIAGEAIGLRKHVGPSLMYMRNAGSTLN